MVGDELTITISLQRVEPLTANPIDAIGGTYAGFFDWQYDMGTNTFLGTQNMEFPGANGGSIEVEISVTSTSMMANPQNGFSANIQPAGYMNATNSTNDDAVSNFTWTDPGAPLPVELSGFKGTANGCSVKLDWSTATELNNSHFEVQHSTTGKEFQALKKVEGAGTTVETQSYTFLHESAANLNYYRLKQVDFDGTFEYSDVISIASQCKSGIDVNIYPTLTKGEAVNVQLQTQTVGTLMFEVVDNYGKVISQRQLQGDATNFVEQFDVSDLVAGQYYLRVIDQNGQSVIKSFVKTN